MPKLVRQQQWKRQNAEWWRTGALDALFGAVFKRHLFVSLLLIRGLPSVCPAGWSCNGITAGLPTYLPTYLNEASRRQQSLTC